MEITIGFTNYSQIQKHADRRKMSIEDCILLALSNQCKRENFGKTMFDSDGKMKKKVRVKNYGIGRRN